MDLDEQPVGRKLNLAGSVDIRVSLIIEKKIPAHVHAGLCGEFPEPAERGVISSLFIRELNAHGCRLAGGSVVDANVNSVKGLRHDIILFRHSKTPDRVTSGERKN